MVSVAVGVVAVVGTGVGAEVGAVDLKFFKAVGAVADAGAGNRRSGSGCRSRM